MSPSPKDRDQRPDAFDPGLLDEQFQAIESTIDGEARSDARTSEHAWKAELQKETLREKVKHLQAQIKDLKNTRKMRRAYARGAMELARAAVLFWVGMFGVVGFSNAMAGRPPFSDQALITLTAGATVNVLAAFIGIIRGLFPSAAHSPPGKAKEPE